MTVEPADSRSPVQVLGPGVVMFSDSALLTIHRLALLSYRVSAGDGVHDSREVHAIHDAVREALAWVGRERDLSPKRRVSRSSEAGCAESDLGEVEIPTCEVARLLDVSARTVQLHADHLRGRRGAGGALVFDRATVQAVADTRRKGARWRT